MSRAAPPASRTKGRRELGIAQKREAILTAAARAFARGGYHATTMNDIAREAGYTPPSLYAYFAGKEQIFVELAALLSREFLAVFDLPIPATLAFPERLELLLHRLFEKAETYRDAVTVFLVARLSGETTISQGPAEGAPPNEGFWSAQLLTAWLRKNAKRGELGGHRPEEMGLALAGLTHAFCIQWLSEGARASIASQAARVASLFLHGVMGPAREKSRARDR